MNKRLISAMAAYAVIATLAGFTLDGLLRTAVWIFMAGLAAKTWIAYKAGWWKGFSAVTPQYFWPGLKPSDRILALARSVAATIKPSQKWIP
jgi:hypothetical protein